MWKVTIIYGMTAPPFITKFQTRGAALEFIELLKARGENGILIDDRTDVEIAKGR